MRRYRNTNWSQYNRSLLLEMPQCILVLQETAVCERNEAVLQIMGLGGDDLARKLWKKLKGYHTRSLVETAMYRLKQLTGERLKSRGWETQCLEADVKCLVINKMTRLGMPRGHWEEAA